MEVPPAGELSDKVSEAPLLPRRPRAAAEAEVAAPRPRPQFSETYIRRLAVLIPLAGSACAVFYSLTAWTPEYGWKPAGHAMATYVLISGASFFSAALLGFLFGFPRTSEVAESVSAVKTPAGPGVRLRYQHNKSIEQISDWLIKMLIGIGLSQMNEFPRLLWFYSSRLTSGVATYGGSASATATGACLILFFLVCGFIEGYLATRLLLPSKLVEVDRASD